MLAVLYRHKALFIALALIILAVLAWIFIAARDNDKTPSRGVFVISVPAVERLSAEENTYMSCFMKPESQETEGDIC